MVHMDWHRHSQLRSGIVKSPGWFGRDGSLGPGSCPFGQHAEAKGSEEESTARTRGICRVGTEYPVPEVVKYRPNDRV